MNLFGIIGLTIASSLFLITRGIIKNASLEEKHLLYIQKWFIRMKLISFLFLLILFILHLYDIFYYSWTTSNFLYPMTYLILPSLIVGFLADKYFYSYHKDRLEEVSID